MTRVARGSALLGACAIAFAGLLGGAASAQEFDPQPYLVYDVTPSAVVPTPTVGLEDQFGQGDDIAVLERAYFMNPVIQQLIGYRGQVPQPIDPRVDYMEDGLLESVIRRGPLYRPTPDAGS